MDIVLIIILLILFIRENDFTTKGTNIPANNRDSFLLISFSLITEQITDPESTIITNDIRRSQRSRLIFFPKYTFPLFKTHPP